MRGIDDAAFLSSFEPAYATIATLCCFFYMNFVALIELSETTTRICHWSAGCWSCIEPELKRIAG